MPFFADFYIFAVKKLFLCIGIEKFEKYLTEICGFLPVIAALLSPRLPIKRPLIRQESAALIFQQLFYSTALIITPSVIPTPLLSSRPPFPLSSRLSEAHGEIS